MLSFSKENCERNETQSKMIPIFEGKLKQILDERLFLAYGGRVKRKLAELRNSLIAAREAGENGKLTRSHQSCEKVHWKDKK